ncbi:MAG TPA: hypothetical protein VIE15_04495 [Acidimicrobiales bacterium]
MTTKTRWRPSRRSLRTRCDLVATVVALERSAAPVVYLDVLVDDGTGTLSCRFFGRPSILGVAVGTRLHVQGRLTRPIGRECLLNPDYELVDTTLASGASS